MKFNSQICTTKEQSERLLALGLKKETADMCIHPSRELVYPFSYSETLTLYDNFGLGKIMETDLLLPAWSLHRLIEMCTIPKAPFIRVEFQNTYDEIISLIAETIKFGAFNKEYLEG